MKLLYITASIPYGKGETFILEEMLELKRQGIDIIVIPRNPAKEIFHKEAKNLEDRTIKLPLIDLKMIVYFLISLILKPSIWRIIKRIVLESRTFMILLKNLIVLPKSVYVTKLINKLNINHIHVHWGSTTATMGYIISSLTSIPWSFTLHRWDIYENNMLKEKVKSAFFVRCISEKGKNDLLDIIGKELDYKVKIIHMGVKIPELEVFLNELDDKDKDKNKNFTIATIASFEPRKGHKYLIEACYLLVSRGIINFKCELYGEGSLKSEIKREVDRMNLSNFIKFYNFIKHEDLIELYKRHKVDLVVLPSITINNESGEGIPVALMEAMAYGIPVISTNTGGISELVENAGIIVPEKDSIALANAIEKCMVDRNYAYKLNALGREKVMKEFNIEENTQKLIEEMKKNMR